MVGILIHEAQVVSQRTGPWAVTFTRGIDSGIRTVQLKVRGRSHNGGCSGLVCGWKKCYFFIQNVSLIMPQTIDKSATSRIYGHGRGWAFSTNDLADLGARPAIDSTLRRLTEKGTIRRIAHGLYDYPQFSPLLDEQLSPNTDQAAQALARKFGWRIQASGVIAENLLGLSTQVPAKAVYLSDGPNRSYRIGSTTITFKHTALKEVGFRLKESELIVQALKSIGPKRITPEVVSIIRARLPEHLRAKVLTDTRTATGWVRAAIQRIAKGDNAHG